MSIKLGIYKHRNGNLYQVIGVARDVKTLEEVVMYQGLYGNYGCWVRSLANFTEKVSDDEGREVPRFTFIGGGRSELPLLR